MKKIKSFRKNLIRSLKDPIEASEYINAALREGDSSFLLEALRDVTEAQGGFSKLARATKLNRANLYQMLSAKGNPRIQSIESVLKVFGLRFGVLPDSHRKAA